MDKHKFFSNDAILSVIKSVLPPGTYISVDFRDSRDNVYIGWNFDAGLYMDKVIEALARFLHTDYLIDVPIDDGYMIVIYHKSDPAAIKGPGPKSKCFVPGRYKGCSSMINFLEDGKLE